MGTIQGFHDTNGRRSSSPSSSKQDFEVGFAASIINFMTQGCLGTKKKRRKRPSHPQPKKHHHLLKDTGIEIVTLEEWIIQSPWLNRSFEVDLMQVSKPVSKRVHRSSFDRTHHERCISKCREGSCSVKISSVKSDHVEVKSLGVEDSFSFPTNQSEKLKKRVSFKEPEVADVFILNSPESNTPNTFENVEKS